MTLSAQHSHGQGRSQQFFQGKAPSGFNEGLPGAPGGRLPNHISISGGGGSIPIFGRFNGQNERISWPGGMTPLPLPAYAYRIDSIALYITEKQLYTFSLRSDCRVLVKVVGNR